MKQRTPVILAGRGRTGGGGPVTGGSELDLAGREGLVLHDDGAAGGQNHDVQVLLPLVSLLVPVPGHLRVVGRDQSHLTQGNKIRITQHVHEKMLEIYSEGEENCEREPEQMWRGKRFPGHADKSDTETSKKSKLQERSFIQADKTRHWLP